MYATTDHACEQDTILFLSLLTTIDSERAKEIYSYMTERWLSVIHVALREICHPLLYSCGMEHNKLSFAVQKHSHESSNTLFLKLARTWFTIVTKLHMLMIGDQGSHIILSGKNYGMLYITWDIKSS